MKIGLASYRFINHQVAYNLSQIKKAMRLASGKVDLLCFGESFLQGFDALHWNYDHDKEIAITQTSAIMRKLCEATLRYQVDLALGYIEKSQDRLYSSYAVIERGRLLHNYRRISRGWKEFRITDDHYQEGTATTAFWYHGQKLQIALCGDLWDFPERFKTDGLLIWPVYVNFSLDEWKTYEQEYAQQASLAASKTVLINSIAMPVTTSSPASISHGGAFYFVGGATLQKLPYDEERILIVDA